LAELNLSTSAYIDIGGKRCIEKEATSTEKKDAKESPRLLTLDYRLFNRIVVVVDIHDCS
jgi:hypothetical protein